MLSLSRYGRFVHANLSTKGVKLWQELWLPASQVELCQSLGVLEYLAFSDVAADESADISLGLGHSPTVQELHLAATEFVRKSIPRSKTLLPNIVFFHAESTFDPESRFQAVCTCRIAVMVQAKRDPRSWSYAGEHHRRRKLGLGIRGAYRSGLQDLRIPGFLHALLHRAKGEKLLRRVSGKEGI